MCKAKFSARLICMLTLLLSSQQLTAQNDTIIYINILDSCSKYIILPDGKISMPNQCEYDINFKGNFNNAGKHYKGRAVFEKRRIYDCPTIAGEEMYRFYAENTDIEIYKLSIIDKDSFLIITGLKSGPGIDCHYMGSAVLERSDRKGCFQPNPFYRPLEIFIENYKHNAHIQLAMDQRFVEGNVSVDSSKVYIKNGQYGKTHRRSNPEDLVSQKYRFYLVDKGIHGDLLQQAVPVIFAPVPSVYMPLEDRKKVIEKYQSLLGESVYFISCARFNPGRDYVNTTYGEEIEGNVLSFMLYSMGEYLKE